MPTAAASFDDAFEFDEPARKKAPRKPRATAQKGTPGKGKKKGRRFPFDMHRVARYAAIGMGATVALAIMVNALALQKGHHPAPLFGKAIALGPSPVAAPRPAPALPAEDAMPSPAAVPPPSRRAAIDAEPSAGDPIAQLIHGQPIRGTGVAAQPAPKVESKTVIGAQRALAKLGFALKPSGTVGPQTRKAIEAFERDRHLPVKGELTHRVVKILAAESGVKID